MKKVFKDTDVLFQELVANVDKPVEFYGKQNRAFTYN